ncbi:NlpC/P60 family protein [Stackebrandtia soli]|uniref:C40 family peptidase n=1 Tax=Stackebrandtia soli TaxID=1892856 RepID=UPI0039E7B255
MKKRHAFIAAAATALLLISIAPGAAHADPDSLEEVEAELKERGEELEAVIEDYNGANEDLKKTEKRIKKIEKSLPKLEEEAEEARLAATDIAVAAYTKGNDLSAVGSILGGSPNRAIDRITAMSALNASQAEDLDRFIEAQTNLEEELATLEETKVSQKAIKKEIGKKKSKIEGEMADLDELKAQLSPPSAPDISQFPPAPSGAAGDAVSFAYAQVGEPYSWGAAGPDAWDCSGLTMGAWNAAGVGLPHNAASQYNSMPHVSRANLAPGDLVFYNGLNHVGIYAGDGVVVHAPTSGQNVSVVGIDSMPIDGYGRPG